MPMKVIPQETLDKLNRETSRIAANELHSFFEQGAVLAVAPGMDLVKVAGAMAVDDSATVGKWLQNGQIEKADDTMSERWMKEEISLWAVVVAPWVLVQPPERDRD